MADSSSTRSSVSAQSTLSTAHELLVKWGVMTEREKLWSELHTAMTVLGSGIGWQLPGRLRLVGVVVQVVDALSSKMQATPVIDAVHGWLENVQTQQSLGKLDPLQLLNQLGCCMESAEFPDSGASAKASGALPVDLEMQVVEAARIISLHLDSQVLEKALIATVVGKDFEATRQLVDELELLSRFSAVGAPESAPPLLTKSSVQPATTGGVPATQSGPPTLVQSQSPKRPARQSSQLFKDPHSGRSPEQIHSQRSEDELEVAGQDGEASRSQLDVEDTLAAMVEMGAEELDDEDEAEVIAETQPSELLPGQAEAQSSPPDNVTPMQQFCTTKPWGKRKRDEPDAHPGAWLQGRTTKALATAELATAELQDRIEDPSSTPPASQPRRFLPQSFSRLAPLHVRSSSSSGNALFEAPMPSLPSQAQASSSGNALFDSPIRSTPRSQGVVVREAPFPRQEQVFADQEVPEKGSAGRKPWTSEEEQRLIAGHRRYGNRWEHIRTTCGLKHRYGTQIRDKWVNLQKAGRVS